MKTKQELENMRNQMIVSIPKMMDDAASKDDEEEGLMEVGVFLGELTMINFALDEKGLPFEVIAKATQAAFESAIQRAAVDDLKELLINATK
jgi:hypothetical protein